MAQMKTKGNRRSLCSVHWHLFKVSMSNEYDSIHTSSEHKCLLTFLLFHFRHTLLFVFKRHSGTNFSGRQRLALFFMYLCTLMVAAAIFYGQDQSSVIKDILASLITSLVGTMPQNVIKIFFLKTKPRTKDMSKEILQRVSSTDGREIDMEEYQRITAKREELYKDMYKFPPICNEIAWCLLLTISVAACFVAVCSFPLLL